MKIYTENFTIILNKHITNTYIDAHEFRVLCYLLMLSDGEGTCYPSYKTIANKIGISETKTKSAIKHLIEQGLIKKQNREKTDGSTSSNLYVVCEKTTMQVAEDTTPCTSEDRGSVHDDYNKYTNINNNFNNNHHLSIEDVLRQAGIDKLQNEMKKNYESAIEFMYHSKSVSVGGRNISGEIVYKQLENISYEHIVYVDNNMPRKMVDGKVEVQVRSPVPYIVTALYNALKYKEDEIARMW